MKFYYFLPLILLCITTSQLLIILLPSTDLESRGVIDLGEQDIGRGIINNDFQTVPPLRNKNYSSSEVSYSETKTTNETHPNIIKDEGGNTLTKFLVTENVDYNDKKTQSPNIAEK